MFPSSHCVLLSTIYRQENADFRTFLNAVRVGKIDEAFVRNLAEPLEKRDSQRALPFRKTVHFFATRLDAMVENYSHMEKHPGEENVYKALDTGSHHSLMGCQMPRILALKIGGAGCLAR